MFIGYFYGIRWERQLEREIQTNVAYLWSLGLNLNAQFLIIQLSVGIEEHVLRIRTEWASLLTVTGIEEGE